MRRKLPHGIGKTFLGVEKISEKDISDDDFEYVLRSPKETRLANIPARCGIDYDLGHYPIFTVVAKCDKRGGIYSRHFVSGRIEMHAPEFPSFYDFDVFIGVIKAFEDLKKINSVYVSPDEEIDVENFGRVTRTHTIAISKKRLCEYCGFTYSGANKNSILESLVRLRDTTVYYYKEHRLERTFSFISDLRWEPQNVFISMNPELIEVTWQRNHKIRWRALQKLKSQVEKGLLLYIDCNNIYENLIIHEDVIFNYLFRSAKGAKSNNHETTNYIKNSREHRRMVNNALRVLLKENLISEYWMNPTLPRSWGVVRSNFYGRPLKAPKNPSYHVAKTVGGNLDELC
ncbi:MAG: hypothetical protein FPO08_05700 [Geobacter sp.]|nr:MAG: hypothetical protein FPO08_05700 [Geobacter sp.]